MAQSFEVVSGEARCRVREELLRVGLNDAVGTTQAVRGEVRLQGGQAGGEFVVDLRELKTDGEGRAAFLTLFPGWYPGRTPHLHLRVEARGGVFATQLFFEEIQRRVYALPPYRERGMPRVGNR